MFGPPVRVTGVWKSGRFWKWRDAEGTIYGVSGDDFIARALTTIAKKSKEDGTAVIIDSHATAYDFRYVRAIERVTTTETAA